MFKHAKAAEKSREKFHGVKNPQMRRKSLQIMS